MTCTDVHGVQEGEFAPVLDVGGGMSHEIHFRTVEIAPLAPNSVPGDVWSKDTCLRTFHAHEHEPGRQALCFQSLSHQAANRHAFPVSTMAYRNVSELHWQSYSTLATMLSTPWMLPRTNAKPMTSVASPHTPR